MNACRSQAPSLDSKTPGALPLCGPKPPLVVDLDGTLTPTDTLFECLVRLIKERLTDALRLPLWLLTGLPAFKARVASRARLPVDLLPYRQPLIDYLRREKHRGRTIVLATAAPRPIAQAVAAHLGLFDHILSSDSELNLKGSAKLQAIRDAVGPSFVYAGNSRADLPVWQGAEAVVLARGPDRLQRMVRKHLPVEHEFPPSPATVATWLRALRIHQWTKNLLVFVPLLTSFEFADPARLAAAVVAFVAFSLVASATYVANDLLDLDSDRAHPRKRNRPFASAELSIPTGVILASTLLLATVGLAAVTHPALLTVLLLYLCLATAYSLGLKRYVLFDVILLALLYTVRIVGGSMAGGVAISVWLFAFSVFLFLSLALVKRCAELVTLRGTGQELARGRDYRVDDLTVLWPLGVGSGLCAIVVFGLFINSPDTQTKYATPELLWLVGVGLIYWIARLWIKTARGEMHDDPLVFAVRDRGSRLTVLAILAATVAARLLRWVAP